MSLPWQSVYVPAALAEDARATLVAYDATERAAQDAAARVALRLYHMDAARLPPFEGPLGALVAAIEAMARAPDGDTAAAAAAAAAAAPGSDTAASSDDAAVPDGEAAAAEARWARVFDACALLWERRRVLVGDVTTFPLVPEGVAVGRHHVGAYLLAVRSDDGVPYTTLEDALRGAWRVVRVWLLDSELSRERRAVGQGDGIVVEAPRPLVDDAVGAPMRLVRLSWRADAARAAALRGFNDALQRYVLLHSSDHRLVRERGAPRLLKAQPVDGEERSLLFARHATGPFASWDDVHRFLAGLGQSDAVAADVMQEALDRWPLTLDDDGALYREWAQLHVEEPPVHGGVYRVGVSDALSLVSEGLYVVQFLWRGAWYARYTLQCIVLPRLRTRIETALAPATPLPLDDAALVPFVRPRLPWATTAPHSWLRMDARGELHAFAGAEVRGVPANNGLYLGVCTLGRAAPVGALRDNYHGVLDTLFEQQAQRASVAADACSGGVLPLAALRAFDVAWPALLVVGHAVPVVVANDDGSIDPVALRVYYFCVLYVLDTAFRSDRPLQLGLRLHTPLPPPGAGARARARPLQLDVRAQRRVVLLSRVDGGRDSNAAFQGAAHAASTGVLLARVDVEVPAGLALQRAAGGQGQYLALPLVLAHSRLRGSAVVVEQALYRPGEKRAPRHVVARLNTAAGEVDAGSNATVLYVDALTPPPDRDSGDGILVGVSVSDTTTWAQYGMDADAGTCSQAHVVSDAQRQAWMMSADHLGLITTLHAPPRTPADAAAAGSAEGADVLLQELLADYRADEPVTSEHNVRVLLSVERHARSAPLGERYVLLNSGVLDVAVMQRLADGVREATIESTQERARARPPARKPARASGAVDEAGAFAARLQSITPAVRWRPSLLITGPYSEVRQFIATQDLLQKVSPMLPFVWLHEGYLARDRCEPTGEEATAIEAFYSLERARTWFAPWRLAVVNATHNAARGLHQRLWTRVRVADVPLIELQYLALLFITDGSDVNALIDAYTSRTDYGAEPGDVNLGVVLRLAGLVSRKVALYRQLTHSYGAALQRALDMVCRVQGAYALYEHATATSVAPERLPELAWLTTPLPAAIAPSMDGVADAEKLLLLEREDTPRERLAQIDAQLRQLYEAHGAGAPSAASVVALLHALMQLLLYWRFFATAFRMYHRELYSGEQLIVQGVDASFADKRATQLRADLLGLYPLGHYGVPVFNGAIVRLTPQQTRALAAYAPVVALNDQLVQDLQAGVVDVRRAGDAGADVAAAAFRATMATRAGLARAYDDHTESGIGAPLLDAVSYVQRAADVAASGCIAVVRFSGDACVDAARHLSPGTTAAWRAAPGSEVLLSRAVIDGSRLCFVGSPVAGRLYLDEQGVAGSAPVVTGLYVDVEAPAAIGAPAAPDACVAETTLGAVFEYYLGNVMWWRPLGDLYVSLGRALQLLAMTGIAGAVQAARTVENEHVQLSATPDSELRSLLWQDLPVRGACVPPRSAKSLADLLVDRAEPMGRAAARDARAADWSLRLRAALVSERLRRVRQATGRDVAGASYDAIMFDAENAPGTPMHDLLAVSDAELAAEEPAAHAARWTLPQLLHYRGRAASVQGARMLPWTHMRALAADLVDAERLSAMQRSLDHMYGSTALGGNTPLAQLDELVRTRKRFISLDEMLIVGNAGRYLPLPDVARMRALPRPASVPYSPRADWSDAQEARRVARTQAPAVDEGFAAIGAATGLGARLAAQASAARDTDSVLRHAYVLAQLSTHALRADAPFHEDVYDLPPEGPLARFSFADGVVGPSVVALSLPDQRDAGVLDELGDDVVPDVSVLRGLDARITDAAAVYLDARTQPRTRAPALDPLQTRLFLWDLQLALLLLEPATQRAKDDNGDSRVRGGDDGNIAEQTYAHIVGRMDSAARAASRTVARDLAAAFAQHAGSTPFEHADALRFEAADFEDAAAASPYTMLDDADPGAWPPPDDAAYERLWLRRPASASHALRVLHACCGYVARVGHLFGERGVLGPQMCDAVRSTLVACWDVLQMRAAAFAARALAEGDAATALRAALRQHADVTRCSTLPLREPLASELEGARAAEDQLLLPVRRAPRLDLVTLVLCAVERGRSAPAQLEALVARGAALSFVRRWASLVSNAAMHTVVDDRVALHARNVALPLQLYVEDSDPLGALRSDRARASARSARTVVLDDTEREDAHAIQLCYTGGTAPGPLQAPSLQPSDAVCNYMRSLDTRLAGTVDDYERQSAAAAATSPRGARPSHPFAGFVRSADDTLLLDAPQAVPGGDLIAAQLLQGLLRWTETAADGEERLLVVSTGDALRDTLPAVLPALVEAAAHRPLLLRGWLRVLGALASLLRPAEPALPAPVARWIAKQQRVCISLLDHSYTMAALEALQPLLAPRFAYAPRDAVAVCVRWNALRDVAVAHLLAIAKRCRVVAALRERSLPLARRLASCM